MSGRALASVLTDIPYKLFVRLDEDGIYVRWGERPCGQFGE